MRPKRRHKVKYAASVGGIFLIMALVGIITVAVVSIRWTMQLLDNQRQKNMFETLIRPVVMFDPAPFGTPSDIKMDRLLLYSMWTILQDEKVSGYARSEENQTLQVPASDLQSAAFRLFGEGITLEHQTFTDNESVYFYNQERNTYEVSTYGFLYVYKPEVLDITKADDGYHLLVKYISPDNAWASIYAGEKTAMLESKQLIYVVRETANGWNLVAIQEVLSPLDNPTGEVSAKPDLERPAESSASAPTPSSESSQESTESSESPEESSETTVIEVPSSYTMPPPSSTAPSVSSVPSVSTPPSSQASVPASSTAPVAPQSPVSEPSVSVESPASSPASTPNPASPESPVSSESPSTEAPPPPEPPSSSESSATLVVSRGDDGTDVVVRQ